MIIKFNPQRAEAQTTASLKGNILTYNGEDIDLSVIPNGATAKSDTITIDKSLQGETTITMLWQYTENTKENCFPKDLQITEGEIYPTESTNEI